VFRTGRFKTCLSCIADSGGEESERLGRDANQSARFKAVNLRFESITSHGFREQIGAVERAAQSENVENPQSMGINRLKRQIYIVQKSPRTYI